jgi:hypothetical protein
MPRASGDQDAAWVAFNNSLKCSSLSHIFLLLKSSDFIAHDLTAPFKFCSDIDEAATDVEYSLGKTRRTASKYI